MSDLFFPGWGIYSHAIFLLEKGRNDRNRIVLAHLVDVFPHEDPALFPLLSYVSVFSLLRAVPWFWMGKSTLQEAS